MSVGFAMIVVGAISAFTAVGDVLGIDAATLGLNLVVAGALALLLAVVRRLGGAPRATDRRRGVSDQPRAGGAG